MAPNFQEKRREPRRPASGRLVFRLIENGRSPGIEGDLVDVSDSGFRAKHAHAALAPGQEVAFEHPMASGKARVIWNRILGRAVESGFLVL